ncbi:hypothetical protein ACFQ1E_10290 [Sphingomonas canadensis]|uniref:Uncharacterized protein n=1 Tax=Sphingomonas canadensis TaxID=1219257 RepID=A0ABW3H5H0_9SPHN|nr:hypothetical protein [Sphingomonas canadensis]MCW3836493.1 hypothetical protein [Sphingomonas canadensis]
MKAAWVAIGAVFLALIPVFVAANAKRRADGAKGGGGGAIHSGDSGNADSCDAGGGYGGGAGCD